MSWYGKGRRPKYTLPHRKTPFHSCWEWVGGKNNWGYGQFYEDCRGIKAHRWSYLNFVGPIPRGMILMHTCDNPACVNPEHLKLGTNKENAQDAVRKGRMSRCSPRVSPEKRAWIAELTRQGLAEHKIAAIVDVSVTTARKYKRVAEAALLTRVDTSLDE